MSFCEPVWFLLQDQRHLLFAAAFDQAPLVSGHLQIRGYLLAMLLTDFEFIACVALLFSLLAVWFLLHPLMILSRLRQILQLLSGLQRQQVKFQQSISRLVAQPRTISEPTSTAQPSPTTSWQPSAAAPPTPISEPLAVPKTVFRPQAVSEQAEHLARELASIHKAQTMDVGEGIAAPSVSEPAPTSSLPSAVPLEEIEPIVGELSGSLPVAHPVTSTLTSIAKAAASQPQAERTAAGMTHEAIPSVTPHDTDQTRETPMPQPRQSSRFEQVAADILRRIWNWIIVGEEHIPAGMSYEFAVAVHWLLRLGVVLIVVGMAFFLRYSVEQGWVPPEARVAIAACVGLSLLTVGTWMLPGRLQLLAMGIQAIGLTSLYFSVYAAHHWYGLITQPLAFGLMCLITLTTAGIAVGFNSLYVAFLVLLGGYATPFLVPTKTVDLVALYTYLIILGAGLLTISLWRNWPVVNLVSFVANYIIAVAALLSDIQNQTYTPAQFWRLFSFFSGMFMTFSTLVWLHNFRKRIPSNLLDWFVLLVNALIYIAITTGLLFLVYDNEQARYLAGLVTIALCAFYIGHVWFLVLSGHKDEELQVGFLGLAAFFLAITFPLILSNEWWTSAWAIQALVMLWLSDRLSTNFLRQVAYLVFAIVLTKLTFDLPRYYADTEFMETVSVGKYLQDELLRRLIIFGIPLGCLIVGAIKLWPPGLSLPQLRQHPRAIKQANPGMVYLSVSAAIAVFVWLHFELWRTVGYFYEPVRLPILTWLYIALAGMALWIYTAIGLARWFLPIPILLCLVVLVKFLIDLANWPWLYDLITASAPARPYQPEHILPRLLDFLGVILLFGLAARVLRVQPRGQGDVREFFLVITLILGFIFATLEASIFLLNFFPKFHAGGISLLWGLFALGLIVGGLLSDSRALRIYGLFLFAVVAGKIFLSDLAHLEMYYRFLAFVLVGIIALAGSYVYLRAQQTFSRASVKVSGFEGQEQSG